MSEICFNSDHVKKLEAYDLPGSEPGFSRDEIDNMIKDRETLFTEQEWKRFGKRVLTTSQNLLGPHGVLSPDYFQNAILRICPLYSGLQDVKYLVTQGPVNEKEAFNELEKRFLANGTGIGEIEIPVNFEGRNAFGKDLEKWLNIKDSVMIKRDQSPRGRWTTITVFCKNMGKYEPVLIFERTNRRVFKDFYKVIEVAYDGMYRAKLDINPEMSNRIDGSQQGGFLMQAALQSYAVIFPEMRLGLHPILGSQFRISNSNSGGQRIENKVHPLRQTNESHGMTVEQSSSGPKMIHESHPLREENSSE